MDDTSRSCRRHVRDDVRRQGHRPRRDAGRRAPARAGDRRLARITAEPLVFINPQIIEREARLEAEEGCLSVPGVFDMLTHPLRARSGCARSTATASRSSWKLDGLLAVCVQHEMDHLEGKLFVDYLSELKRNRIRKKLEKERRERIGDGETKSRVPAI